MKLILHSKPVEIFQPTDQYIVTGPHSEIHLFTQFFVHKNAQRNEEIRYCLQRNCDNPHVGRIHLLNERVFTSDELGVTGEGAAKIHQEVVGKRLNFQTVFQYIRESRLKGYFVLANADIFTDTTLGALHMTTMHQKKQAMVQLRYDYHRADEPLEKAVLFGPRFDSQDTWIFHSSFPIQMNQEKLFAFDFGRPGCDNKIVYLLCMLGYEMFNDPSFVRTYHYHRSVMRDYFGKESVPKPWGVVVPYGSMAMTIPPSLGINLQEVCLTTQGFQYMNYDDHTMLYDYIAGKLQAGENFIIPRIAGIENNFAVFARIMVQSGGNQPNLEAYFNQVRPAMKTNAGILLSSWPSIQKYSALYLKAFDNCDMYSGWEIQGEVYKHINQSHDFIRSTYGSKRIFWAFALDVFHYIYDAKAWTKSLQGRRILIVSPFVESIRERVPKRAQLYDGVDLFPGCTFVYIAPPMTQAGENSREFDVELDAFCRRLDELKDSYDVALVSCGGYGNLVCNYIFENHQKSAVYVGGVLQMYFGVLGGRWLKERADVVRLFLNEHWGRPKQSERPSQCDAIENGCYW